MRNEKRTSKSKKTVNTPPSRAEARWAVADAKARLSEVLDKARTEGPQVITRNGKEAAVVVGIEEWERKTKRKGTLAEFLYNSPLRGSDIVIERSLDEPRDIFFDDPTDTDRPNG